MRVMGLLQRKVRVMETEEGESGGVTTEEGESDGVTAEEGESDGDRGR